MVTLSTFCNSLVLCVFHRARQHQPMPVIIRRLLFLLWRKAPRHNLLSKNCGSLGTNLNSPPSPINVVYNSVDQHFCQIGNSPLLGSIPGMEKPLPSFEHRNGSSEGYVTIPNDRKIHSASKSPLKAKKSVASETAHLCSNGQVVKSLNDVTKFLHKYEELQMIEYEWRNLSQLMDKLFAFFFALCAVIMAITFKFCFVDVAVASSHISDNLCEQFSSNE